MLSYDLYAVVKDDKYLCHDQDEGFYFNEHVSSALLYDMLHDAKIDAKFWRGTVHQVTIVSVPMENKDA